MTKNEKLSFLQEKKIRLKRITNWTSISFEPARFKTQIKFFKKIKMDLKSLQ